MLGYNQSLQQLSANILCGMFWNTGCGVRIWCRDTAEQTTRRSSRSLSRVVTLVGYARPGTFYQRDGAQQHPETYKNILLSSPRLNEAAEGRK